MGYIAKGIEAKGHYLLDRTQKSRLGCKLRQQLRSGSHVVESDVQLQFLFFVAHASGNL